MSAGRQHVALGDLVDIVGGGTPSKNNSAFYGGEVPWATVRDMKADYIASTEHSITQKAIKSSSTKIIPAGEVVIATRVGLGKVCIVKQDTAINQDLRGLVPKPKQSIDRRYLFYWFKSITNEVVKAGTGATVQGVKLPFIKGLQVPLPPLDEQKRIVAILDEAFEGLDRARANAEANLQNARELFENSLAAELSAIGHSNEVSLGEHIDLLAGYAFKSAGYTDDQNAVRLLRGDNIVPGAVRWEGAKYWPLEDCEGYEKYQLMADDILIAMDRTWIKAGIKYAVLTDQDLPSLLVQRVARLRCLASLDTHYLAVLIGSKSFERYVLSIQTGIGVPHISPTQIRGFSFPLPDIATQAQIVERLTAVKDASNDLLIGFTIKLKDFDDLRQSLLQKAFAGELT